MRGTCARRRSADSGRASRAAWPTRRHGREKAVASSVSLVAAALAAAVAVFLLAPRPLRGLAAVIAPFAEKLKSQRPCNRRSLDQPDSDRVAETVGLAGGIA